MRVDIKQVVTVAFPAKATCEGSGECASLGRVTRQMEQLAQRP